MNSTTVILTTCAIFFAWCGYVNKTHAQHAVKPVALWRANEQPGFINHAMVIASSERNQADKITCLWGTAAEVAQCH